MEAVAAHVADGNILNLIKKFLRADVMEEGVFKPTTVGTPQGGVVSPVLANIVLHHLDWQLHEHGYRFARYADDNRRFRLKQFERLGWLRLESFCWS